MGGVGSKGDTGPMGPAGKDGVISLSSLSTEQFDRLLTAILNDSRSKGPAGPTGPTGPAGNINDINDFKNNNWKTYPSEDKLCVQNGTNPIFCVNKYGMIDSKKKISFPWTKKCLDSSLIETTNLPSSSCDSNDNKMYYYTELNGGVIRLVTDPSKCLKVENNKLVKRDCDITDDFQKFSKIGTVIHNYKSEKSIDIGVTDGVYAPNYNADNQESMLIN